MTTLIIAAILVLGVTTLPAQAADMEFGPQNPFYAPSTLPFQAPPFDKIKDSDYQPAIEAGMAQQKKEMEAIANDPAAPTFENTFIPMEKSGLLLHRASAAFFSVSAADTNPTLQKIRSAIAPQMAAHADAVHLNPKLFARVAAIYNQRQSLKLDPESVRLVEVTYDQFVHAGANLSEADKMQLKKLNEEIASLSTEFSNKLLAATKAGAYITTDKSALAGFNDAQTSAAA
jgi:peptidyl-dipeptidase Dcp